MCRIRLLIFLLFRKVTPSAGERGGSVLLPGTSRVAGAVCVYEKLTKKCICMIAGNFRPFYNFK